MSGAIDLSSGDFTVVEDGNPITPLKEKVITQNETWTQKTINGDLYIGPEAVLTINGNVTVTGDIYVLGAIKNYGNLTVNGSINASRINWGNSTLSNGTVLMLGGSNSISSLNASNRPFKDIPFEIYTDPIISENGKVTNVVGATLPIVDMSVEGLPVQLKYNGTFSIDEIDVGQKDAVTFTFTDVFGNTITKKVPVKMQDTTPPTATTNVKGGYYGKAKEVTLTMTEDGTIYYTLDGENPTANSKKYNDPIKIEEDTVLKYMAIDKAGNQSEVYTEKYEFFSVNPITDKSTSVTGKAQPNSIIKVTVDKQEWETKANAEGDFSVEIPVQTAKTAVIIIAKDSDGNISEGLEVIVSVRKSL